MKIFGGIFKRKAELNEELESHLRMAVADRVARGESADGARREAMREFGSVPLVADVTRERWGGIWLERLWVDVDFGWRQLRKRKVTTAAAVLSLGLAIGSCMAAFRLVDALFLRPLPITHPERLYGVFRSGPDLGDGSVREETSFEYSLFEQMRDAVEDKAVVVAVGYVRRRDITYQSPVDLEKAQVQYVSGSMFDTFGLQPEQGRLPQAWAMTQNNIGNALLGLAKWSEGPQASQYLQQAAEAYHNALQIYSREQLPQIWAMTQNNIGNALLGMVKWNEGPQASQYLQQAIEAYHNALQIFTREQLPQAWANTQNNLGSSLQNLAERSGEPQASQCLQQAMEAYRNALLVYTREQLPQGWAMTQNNLGNALVELAKRSEGPQMSQYLQQAVESYRSALEVYTESRFTSLWAQATMNLAIAYEAEKDWDSARKCYAQLLSYYPTNRQLQAKVKELSETH